MKKSQLAAKFFMFAAGMVWMLIYLYTCIIGFDFFRDIVYSYGEVEPNNWFMNVMETWYLLTCLAFGVIAARRTFMIIGSWERSNGNGKKEESSS